MKTSFGIKFFFFIFILFLNNAFAEQEYLRKGPLVGQYDTAGGFILKSAKVNFQLIDGKLLRIEEAPYLYASEYSEKLGRYTKMIPSLRSRASRLRDE